MFLSVIKERYFKLFDFESFYSKLCHTKLSLVIIHKFNNSPTKLYSLLINKKM